MTTTSTTNQNNYNQDNNQSQTTTDLEQFYTEVLKDLAIQERLKAATDPESLSELAVELGKEKGYSFPKQDVLAQLECSNAEEPLSEEELVIYELFNARLPGNRYPPPSL